MLQGHSPQSYGNWPRHVYLYGKRTSLDNRAALEDHRCWRSEARSKLAIRLISPKFKKKNNRN